MSKQPPLWFRQVPNAHEPERRKWEVTFYQPSKKASEPLTVPLREFIREKEAAGDVVLAITWEDVYLTPLDWTRAQPAEMADALPTSLGIKDEDLPVF